MSILFLWLLFWPWRAMPVGVTNPDIYQGNIRQTICNPNWSTRSIRPPENYTYSLKRRQMAENGLTGRPSDYEEDHLISLEIGGHPTDPRNLWPQPWPEARQKDQVENYLHRRVCDGSMLLVEAQRRIVQNWRSVYAECCSGERK